MMKNIVFDMGQVLIRFDVNHYISRFAASEDDRELLRREVFRSVEWVQLDRNSITEEQAILKMCSRLPEHLHKSVSEIFEYWHQDIPPIDGMYDLVLELKEIGYPMYLLSNASLRHKQFEKNISALKYFTGIYFSSDHHKLKPESDMFYDFLDTFNLKAEECVFIDDMPYNIEAALRCGYQGVVFHGSVPDLRRKLNKLGINIKC